MIISIGFYLIKCLSYWCMIFIAWDPFLQFLWNWLFINIKIKLWTQSFNPSASHGSHFSSTSSGPASAHASTVTLDQVVSTGKPVHSVSSFNSSTSVAGGGHGSFSLPFWFQLHGSSDSTTAFWFTRNPHPHERIVWKFVMKYCKNLSLIIYSNFKSSLF